MICSGLKSTNMFCIQDLRVRHMYLTMSSVGENWNERNRRKIGNGDPLHDLWLNWDLDAGS